MSPGLHCVIKNLLQAFMFRTVSGSSKELQIGSKIVRALKRALIVNPKPVPALGVLAVCRKRVRLPWSKKIEFMSRFKISRQFSFSDFLFSYPFSFSLSHLFKMVSFVFKALISLILTHSHFSILRSHPLRFFLSQTLS